MPGDNNLSEYENPILYDKENRGFGLDGAFLLKYANNAKGPVLELGCGTGRITIPMAKKGIDITGMDIVPAMLDHARIKAGDLAVKWLLADVRSYSLGKEYSLIYETGSVFQHMLTRDDQEAYLNQVRTHLAENGRLILSLIFPHRERLEYVDTEIDWYSYSDQDGNKVKVSGVESYDPLTQIKIETAYRRWKDSTGNEHCLTAPLSLRYTYPQEMISLLHYNGYMVEEQYGDWKKTPLTSLSHQIVYVCKKRLHNNVFI